MLFIPFIGKVHLFDWDEINFAEMSREMRLTGEYFKVQVNYEPFYEKLSKETEILEELN